VINHQPPLDREYGRFHRLFCVDRNIRNNLNPYGSEPARDDVGSTCINAKLYTLAPGVTTSFVSK
jgi:hypothetical protein